MTGRIEGVAEEIPGETRGFFWGNSWRPLDSVSYDTYHKSVDNEITNAGGKMIDLFWDGYGWCIFYRGYFLGRRPTKQEAWGLIPASHWE
jgi:hypothetical protein